MITPELVAYVKQSLAQGATQEQVRTALLGQGWSMDDTTDALRIASGPPASPPAPPAVPPALVPGRPQKSTLWLWTTLWLTATFDGLGIGIVLILLGVLAGGFPNIVNLFIGVVALACGSYLASRFVLKRSVVERTRAHRLALYAVCIPTLMPLAVAIFATHTLSGALALVGLTLVNSSVMYGIIRWYLESRGD